MSSRRRRSATAAANKVVSAPNAAAGFPWPNAMSQRPLLLLWFGGGVGVGDACAVGDADGSGDGLAVGVGLPEGVGVGMPPSKWNVRATMSPPRVAIARPVPDVKAICGAQAAAKSCVPSSQMFGLTDPGSSRAINQRPAKVTDACAASSPIG